MVYRPDGATINAGATDAEKALDVSPEHFHAEFHETGRPPVSGSMCVKIKTQHHIRRRANGKVNQPGAGSGCAGTRSAGEINGKLIWSNTGYLINWYLLR